MRKAPKYRTGMGMGIGTGGQQGPLDMERGEEWLELARCYDWVGSYTSVAPAMNMSGGKVERSAYRGETAGCWRDSLPPVTRWDRRTLACTLLSKQFISSSVWYDSPLSDRSVQGDMSTAPAGEGSDWG